MRHIRKRLRDGTRNQKWKWPAIRRAPCGAKSGRVASHRVPPHEARGRHKMSRTPEEAVYSIAAVSKLTGASCHALRVWERRYGFPVPQRSASDHRRYSREQVRALRMITEL